MRMHLLKYKLFNIKVISDNNYTHWKLEETTNIE